MQHLHIRAEACALGFVPVLEVCNDGKNATKVKGEYIYPKYKMAVEYANKMKLAWVPSSSSFHS
jgi:hypothetical protein